MGYEFSFDLENKILYLKRFGEVTVDELYESTQKIFSAKEFSQIDKIVNNISDSKIIKMSSSDLMTFAKSIEKYFKNRTIKLAIISSNDLAYGMARMFETWLNVNSRVFRDEQSAIKWLNSEILQ